jgi:hypothetical protein
MDLHRAGVSAKSRQIIEKVSPKFLVQGMKKCPQKNNSGDERNSIRS